MIFSILFTLILLSSSVLGDSKNLHPTTGLTLADLIKYYNYPVEVHENIQTEDDYSLTLHRIPHGLNNSNQPKKGVVLLMHCLPCSAGVFASLGPERGLAFILADQGYDVWMPNARGTNDSKKHISLSSEDPDFWKFSWHQIGYYDIPASIDYIKEQTGSEKLFYIGFSQGTTSFFVLASDRPEYNDSLRLAVMLAPSAYFHNINNDFIRFLAKYIGPVEIMMEWMRWDEMFPKIEIMDELAAFCGGIGNDFCLELFGLLGVDSDQLEASYLSVFLSFVPAGCAAKQFIHYGQCVAADKFQKYDYGLVGNLGVYGTATPPEYPINKITTPVALFYGVKDEISSVNIEQLAVDLPNAVHTHLVNDPEFNHFDFILSPNVVDLVYNDVIDLMSQC